MYETKYKRDTTLKDLWSAIPISVVEGELENPFIRDAECYADASFILKVTKDSALAKKVYQDFNAVVTNAHFKEKMQQVYDNYRLLHTTGWPAPDFTYVDVNGQQITLSSLRGKYVYIDIWATWCGPCKAQIPFLMKVEEKYKGKNIQFVSLSVDKRADAGAWRKYVTDNQLTGYQVMADKDFNSDFIKKFNIASIPRFILLDAAGKVMDADAKRPSDPALKKQFDQLLGIPVAPFALSPYARETDFSGHWQLDTIKSKFGPSEMFISGALNITKNDTALLIERIYVNKAMKESHYLQQFRLDGTSTQTTTDSGKPEEDSLEDNPDIPALTIDMGIELFPNFTTSYTEAWTLADGGKTLVVDRQVALPGLGLGDKIKIYYDKK
jgi:thiol-disulfide isomerase/thioredoxin